MNLAVRGLESKAASGGVWGSYRRLRNKEVETRSIGFLFKCWLRKRNSAEDQEDVLNLLPTPTLGKKLAARLQPKGRDLSSEGKPNMDRGRLMEQEPKEG